MQSIVLRCRSKSAATSMLAPAGLAKKKVNKSGAVDVWEDEKRFKKVKVYESTFNMDIIEQPLRFVKFVKFIQSQL